MRQLLFAALLLLCCAYGCIADTDYLSPYTTDPNKEPGGPMPNKTKEEIIWGLKVVKYLVDDDEDVNLTKEWQNIRIAVNPGMIQKVMKYCKFKRAWLRGYTFSTHKGFDEKVCEAIKTPGEKKIHTLLWEVMPQAISMHVERLKVKRVKDRLKINVPYDRQLISDAEGTRCVEMVSTSDGDKGMGIPDTDFVIHLGFSTRNPGTKICTYDKDGRPTSAMIKLNPFEIENTDQYIRLVAHEIAHGLGFSMEVEKFKEMVLSGIKSNFVGYKELNSTEIKKRVKEQYGCPGGIGMKLDNSAPKKENDIDTHFDRKAAQHELMAPLKENKGGRKLYSKLTLAALESTGYYQADYNKAEMLLVREWGCNFLKKP
ncbi:leishmanolysin [Trypanosoma theileri]|uniref:Leishmanolysin-like peptidase n=1 Tax=Trypanosoma theileri TaxID=67003 RepID=A0A1X0P1G3_9TRYP|nr:leishmanolysin [Trypanosoma theileri]ORC90250.1 leishmanolysin [Trypanosoma theileri]